MKNTLYLLGFLILLSCAGSRQGLKQGTAKEQQVLFTVAGESVPTEEFIYVYNKNNSNNDSAYSKEDIQEYFELYKKFKLKIAEAKARGIDTTDAFSKEFNLYKEQLKKPYLAETKIIDQLVEEAYKRFEQEINASHILIKIDPNAQPADTLKAYEKVTEIRNKALSGEDFAELAKQYSDDPSAARNGGNLGYFTSFQMVYPFESAAYTTPEGEISQPVRTQFGYHLIKVHDKRPSQGTVTVSHIMLRNGSADDKVLQDKIFEIHEQAVAGASWKQLVEQFSQDINSKKNGGIIQPFKVGQLPFEFQEAAFSLTAVGEISDPVKTPYGWHILRLEDRLPISSFEEMEGNIRSRIERDPRAAAQKDQLVDRLKAENGYQLDTATLQLVYQKIDSTLTKGQWRPALSQETKEKELMKIGGRSVDVNEFLGFILSHQRRFNGEPLTFAKQLFNSFETEQVMAVEESQLEDKYFDYRMLVKEYREGIMLFQLMEEEVWQKAVDDTVGLQNFYEDHKTNYLWKERVKAYIYNSSDKQIIQEIRERITKGDSLVHSKKELENTYNKETALTLQVDSGVYEEGTNALLNNVERKKGLYEKSYGDRFILVEIKEVMPEGPKKLNEIKGLVISDYQNYLENQWLKTLREKYPLEVNDKQLEYVYEKLVK